MTLPKPKIAWIPKSLVIEMEDLKKEEDIRGPHANAITLDKVARYCRVGREAKRLSTLNLGWKPTKLPKPRRKKKKWQLEI